MLLRIININIIYGLYCAVLFLNQENLYEFQEPIQIEYCPHEKRASPLAESSEIRKSALTSFSVWQLLKTKWCILSLPCTYHSNHNPRRKLCGLLWDIKKLIGIVLRSKKVQTIRNAVEWKIHNSSIRRYVHLIVGEILIHGFILILTFVLFVLSFLTSFLTYISSIHLCAVVNSVELLINCLSSHFF